jgi:hypothetical protein
MIKRLTLRLLLLTCAAPALPAQDAPASSTMRIGALTGALAHTSALVVDPAGVSDTRLSAGPTFGLEVQYSAFSSGSIYAGVAGSFSMLEHGANLGVASGPGASAATVMLGTAGLMLEARDWFGNLRPTVRLGAGMKLYSFTANGAASYTGLTGDVGLGFRGGSGPIEVLGEIRFLPGSFDQAKLPLRGLAPQDQQQNDLLFTIGMTIRP